MKKNLLVIIALFALAGSAKAQLLTPVRWSYGAKKISPGEAVVFIKATIDQGWHIYSQHVKDGGPVKTTITFNPSKDYTLIGATLEPKPLSSYEKVFSMSVSYFEGSVVFQQKIRLKAGSAATVKGTLNFMTCNDKQCLPPEDVAFSIPVK